MNKKQLRVYAQKFEGASDLARMVFIILALFLFWILLDFFSGGTAMVVFGIVYVGIIGSLYWWVRSQWRALLAPPPKRKKPVKKPEPPQETP